MTWHFLTTKLTVKDGERALLTRDGRLEQVLGPGRHEDWLEIEDGLSPGDVVILGDPPASNTPVVARAWAEEDPR